MNEGYCFGVDLRRAQGKTTPYGLNSGKLMEGVRVPFAPHLGPTSVYVVQLPSVSLVLVNSYANARA
jgi:hypothetical protein